MAGQAIERLYRLQVDASQANRQLKKINKNTGSIAKGFRGIQNATTAAFSVLGAVRGLQGLTRAADQIQLLEGSLTALTESSVRGADALQRVFDTVADTGASLKDTSSTFQRLTIGLRELGGTNEQIDAVANSFIKLGRVSGTSMFETNAALVQFSQGLASGALQGDELRSIMERLPLITELIANEWNRVNEGVDVTRGQVKQLGREGLLSAQLIANAMLNATDDINRQFSGLVFTLEQELNSLSSTFTQVLAEFSEDTGLGDAIRLGIRGVNETLTQFNRNARIALKDLSDLEFGFNALSVAIVAASSAIILALVPAIERLALALGGLIIAHPVFAFFAALAAAAFLVLQNWEHVSAYFQFRLPQALAQLNVTVLESTKKVLQGIVEIGPAIGNAIIAGVNTGLEQLNKLRAVIRILSSGKIILPSFDALNVGVIEAAEEVTILDEKILSARALVGTLGDAYAKEFARIEKVIREGKDALELFDGPNAVEEDAITKRLDKLRDKVLNLIDPLREFKNSLADLHLLLERDLITEEQFAEYVISVNGSKKATEEATKKIEEQRAALQALGIQLKETLDPMQAIINKFREIDIAIEEGIISPQAGEQVKSLLLDVKDQADASADKILSALQRIKAATDGFARDFTDNLVESLKTGEIAFEKFAISILETMARIVLNSIFERFFAVVFSGISGPGGTGGGGFGGGARGFGSQSQVFGSQVLATGSGADTNAVGVLRPPTYGKGALGGGGSAVTVNITNNALVDIQANETRNANGGIDIDMLITSKVNRAIGDGGLDNALKSSFGLSRRAF